MDLIAFQFPNHDLMSTQQSTSSAKVSATPAPDPARQPADESLNLRLTENPSWNRFAQQIGAIEHALRASPESGLLTMADDLRRIANDVENRLTTANRGSLPEALTDYSKIQELARKATEALGNSGGNPAAQAGPLGARDEAPSAERFSRRVVIPYDPKVGLAVSYECTHPWNERNSNFGLSGSDISRELPNLGKVSLALDKTTGERVFVLELSPKFKGTFRLSKGGETCEVRQGTGDSSTFAGTAPPQLRVSRDELLSALQQQAQAVVTQRSKTVVQIPKPPDREPTSI